MFLQIETSNELWILITTFLNLYKIKLFTNLPNNFIKDIQCSSVRGRTIWGARWLTASERIWQILHLMQHLNIYPQMELPWENSASPILWHINYTNLTTIGCDENIQPWGESTWQCNIFRYSKFISRTPIESIAYAYKPISMWVYDPPKVKKTGRIFVVRWCSQGFHLTRLNLYFLFVTNINN